MTNPLSVAAVSATGKTPFRKLARPAVATLVVAAFAAQATAGEITFTDLAGRLIELPGPAETVVTIPIPTPPVIAAVVGSPDTIQAMHPRALNSLRIGLMSQMFPEMLDIPTDIIRGSGFEPNVEEIAKYHPDVVFQWASQDLSVLENAGFKTVALDTGHAEKLESLLTIVGKVHGKTDKVEEIVSRHVQTRTMLEEQSSDIPESDMPRVLYFYRFHMGGEWQTRGGTVESEYRNWYMRLVGARNVAEGGAGTITFTQEQAVAWEPDIILLNAYEKADVTGADLTPADVYNDPFLSQTPAAQAGRVYKMPVGALWWDSGNQESPLMWMWLSMLAHPERFDFDLRAELGEWFEFLYDYSLSEDEIDDILHVADHEGAAHYDRFRR